MNSSGYTIVFGGPIFEPEAFLKTSGLMAQIIRRGEMLCRGELAEESWLEFGDTSEILVGLDAATEVLDFLHANREELVRLSEFPGVTTRSLNIFGSAQWCSTDFGPADMALMCELSLAFSICVYPDGRINFR